MKWFKQVNSSDFGYFPVSTKSEEDDRRSQLSLESENLLLNELILSRAQRAPTRRNGKWSASVPPIEIENQLPRRLTGGTRVKMPRRNSQDPLMQHLESEDQRMNEVILRRAQIRSVNFVPLANDNAAQNMLETMRQDSERIRRERIRRTRSQQRPPNTNTPSPDVQRLRDEVENLRRENEIYRSLARQAPQTPQRSDAEQRLREEVDNLRQENERLQTQLIVSSPPPPEYAPPPYIRSD